MPAIDDIILPAMGPGPHEANPTAAFPDLGLEDIPLRLEARLALPVLTVSEVQPYGLGERAWVRFALPGERSAAHVCRLSDIRAVEWLDTGRLNGLVCLVQAVISVSGRRIETRVLLHEVQGARIAQLRLPSALAV